MQATSLRRIAVLFAILGAPLAQAQNAIGLTGTNQLLEFRPTAPGTIIATRAVTGLGAGETLLGIDFRPNGQALYGITNTGGLYVINPDTGAAQSVGTLTTAPASGNLGVDFNPAADRLRVISDTGQNLRIDVVARTVTPDLPLNPGTPAIIASAYVTNIPQAPSTTLFNIDGTTNTLNRQIPPNDGTQVPVGALGVDPTGTGGFDVRTVDGVDDAFAALTVGGVTGLYRINLASGAATLIGPIGSGATTLNGIALIPRGATVPTLGPAALAALIGVLALIGFVFLRRRTA
jgi:hypothetical protein